MINLIQRYRKLSQPVKASMWFVICSVLQKGISFITTPIFTRMLSSEQYGVCSVYNSWYNIVSIFFTLNLSAGVYYKGVTKWPDKRHEFTASLQMLSSLVTLCFLIVYLLFMGFWNRLLEMPTLLILFMFLQTFFAPAYAFWGQGQRYDYKYSKLVLITLAISILSPLIAILAIKLTTYKAEARIISFAIVQVCVGLFFYVYNSYKGKKILITKYWKYALSYNLPLIPHYLAQNVLGSSDKIMISRMVGDSEAAIYSVAYIISLIFGIVTYAINSSYIPFTYRSLEKNETVSLNKTSAFLVVGVWVLTIVSMCFGPEIIRIVATPEYYEARWVIPPVAASIMFSFTYTFFGNIEFFFEKTKFVMVASTIAALANLLLNYLFIPIFGYIAAAYTTLICYILLLLMHYWMYKRVCKRMGLKKIYNEKLFFCLGVVNVLTMLLITQIYDYYLIRYSIVLLVSVISIVLRKKIKNTISILFNKGG